MCVCTLGKVAEASRATATWNLAHDTRAAQLMLARGSESWQPSHQQSNHHQIESWQPTEQPPPNSFIDTQDSLNRPVQPYASSCNMPKPRYNANAIGEQRQATAAAIQPQTLGHGDAFGMRSPRRWRVKQARRSTVRKQGQTRPRIHAGAYTGVGRQQIHCTCL